MKKFTFLMMLPSLFFPVIICLMIFGVADWRWLAADLVAMTWAYWIYSSVMKVPRNNNKEKE